MSVKSLGYCDLHEREVREVEFEQKGCWNCYHFSYSADSGYIEVWEAADLLNKSSSTIRRWLKDGRLEGKLFLREWPRFQIGSPRKWLTDEESIRNMSLRQE